MRNKYQLNNKFALITGAAGLLGVEHAKALLEIKTNVIITDINLKKLTITAKKLKIEFPDASILFFKMNVSRENSIKKVVSSLKRKKIKLNILINNSAIDSKVTKNNKMLFSSKFENLKKKEWNKHLDVGLTGYMLCSKYFGEMMKNNRNGGTIINIASDLSVISPNHKIYSKGTYKPIMYSVIKHGVIGLTKYISTYWHKNNIRCNALSPGSVENGQSKKFIKKLKSLIPLNRLAKKNEYKGAIQFLSSDASNYMTGQNLIIDGGRSVW